MRVLISRGLDTPTRSSPATRPTKPGSVVEQQPSEVEQQPSVVEQPEERGRTVETTLSDDELRGLYAAPSKPWLRVNFVSTVDGAATGPDGRSGSINNPADKRVFHLLRDLCDVVVVGAGTARAEGYRPGATPIVVVSLSGRTPETLQGASPGQVLLATVSTSPGLAEARLLLGEENVLELGAERVDLAVLKSALAARGFEDMLCEGGPHLFDGLLTAGVVDELCATQVPMMVGGTHTRMTAGLPLDVRVSLETLLEEDGTLIARWLVS